MAKPNRGIRSDELESTGLMDYTSFNNDHITTSGEGLNEEHRKKGTRLSFLKALIPKKASSLCWMLLAFKGVVEVLFCLGFAFALHTCLATECYLDYIQSSKGKDKSDHNSSNKSSSVVDYSSSVTPSIYQELAVEDSGCKIALDTIPLIPIFPSNTNLTVATFCYGRNNSEISEENICFQDLRDAKSNAGYSNVSNDGIVKVLLGFTGPKMTSLLHLVLWYLFNEIGKEWPNCLPTAQLAVCQYIFPPVLDNENLILSINHSFCEYTRDVECKAAWRKADEKINDFVKDCEKEWPILKYLHMPYCSLMPQNSVSEAKACSFGGISFNFGSDSCLETWQYPDIALELQDVMFGLLLILLLIAMVTGFINATSIKKVPELVFPYGITIVISILAGTMSAFIASMYLSMATKDAHASLFCPVPDASLSSLYERGDSTTTCKISDFLFHSLTMAMGVVWLMSIVIALMKYLLDNGNKPKYNILRTAKTSFLAVTLAIMAILPGVVKLFRQPIVVMPRRPTIFCVDKEEANGFYMFVIPFGIILLLGNLMLIYITWKTKQELNEVKTKTKVDRSMGGMQFFSLKPQLKHLLYHYLVAMILIILFSLSESMRLSAFAFRFQQFSVLSTKLASVAPVPIAGLLYIIPGGSFVAVMSLILISYSCCTHRAVKKQSVQL